MKTFYLTSLGCTRRNLDAQKIFTFFIQNGLIPTDGPKSADIIFVMTCGVVKMVEDECLNLIAEFKEYSGQLIIAGCLPSTNPQKLKAVHQGISISTTQINKIDDLFKDFKIKYTSIKEENWEYAKRFENEKSHLKEISWSKPIKSINKLISYGSIKVKKIINNYCKYKYVGNTALNPNIRISEGCSGNCTYCNVKKAIGDLKSKPIADIFQEIRMLNINGGLGVNLVSSDSGSYGVDLKTSFPELIRRILEDFPNIYINYIQDFGPRWLLKYKSDMIQLFSTGRIKSILIPIQTGSDRILRMMNRSIDLHQFVFAIKQLKEAAPDVKIRSQVIVGFPTETDEDNKNTLALLSQCGFDHVDIFRYSETENSPSKTLTPKVASAVIDQRARYLKKKLKNCYSIIV